MPREPFYIRTMKWQGAQISHIYAKESTIYNSYTMTHLYRLRHFNLFNILKHSTFYQI